MKTVTEQNALKWMKAFANSSGTFGRISYHSFSMLGQPSFSNFAAIAAKSNTAHIHQFSQGTEIEKGLRAVYDS